MNCKIKMIEEIIKEELVEIYFQPIVSVRTKKIYAFEALTRCTYKDKIINPTELFQMAIDANLSLELDVLTFWVDAASSSNEMIRVGLLDSIDDILLLL